MRKYLLLLVLPLAACSTLPQPGQVKKTALYDPKPVSTETGIASWYGGRWIGRLTANGERYKADDITAAHKKLPFNTKVRVVDLKTNKSVIVRINNRGPYVRGRVIDLSVVAARQLGTYDRGLAKVRIEVLREIPVLQKPNIRTKPRTEERKVASAPQPAPTGLRRQPRSS